MEWHNCDISEIVHKLAREFALRLAPGADVSALRFSVNKRGDAVTIGIHESEVERIQKGARNGGSGASAVKVSAVPTDPGVSLKDLQAQIAALQEALVKANTPKRRGRPPKNAAVA